MKKAALRRLGCALIAIMLLGGCADGAALRLQGVSDMLGLDISAATPLAQSDTHGGFHGDGTGFLALEFTDEAAAEAIRGNPAWKALPLPETLHTLAYGRSEGTVSCGPYLTDEGGAPLFPAVEEGFYFFEDRHYESDDPRDDANVLKRHSFNLTLAIYDADSRRLYYCDFDT